MKNIHKNMIKLYNDTNNHNKNNNEEKNTRDANLPPAGSREIPSFDATAIRSSRKMEVLGVNP